MMFGQNDALKVSNFNSTEDNFLSKDEMESFYKDLEKQCKLLIFDANEKMIARNRSVGGAKHNFDKYDLVYIKDFRLLPKKKYKQKFFSSPHP